MPDISDELEPTSHSFVTCHLAGGVARRGEPRGRPLRAAVVLTELASGLGLGAKQRAVQWSR
jgi:hypothetical protein